MDLRTYRLLALDGSVLNENYINSQAQWCSHAGFLAPPPHPPILAHSCVSMLTWEGAWKVKKVTWVLIFGSH